MMRKNNKQQYKPSNPLDRGVPALPYWVNGLIILACYLVVSYLDYGDLVVSV